MGNGERGWVGGAGLAGGGLGGREDSREGFPTRVADQSAEGATRFQRRRHVLRHENNIKNHLSKLYVASLQTPSALREEWKAAQRQSEEQEYLAWLGSREEVSTGRGGRWLAAGVGERIGWREGAGRDGTQGRPLDMETSHMLGKQRVKTMCVMSWNVGYHRGVQVFEGALLAAYRHIDTARRAPFVLLLQECGHWGSASGQLYTHVVQHQRFQTLLYSEEGSDCAIAIPAAWAPQIRYSHFGNDFCVLAIGSFILLSAHLLDVSIDEGRADVVFFESMHHISVIKTRFPSLRFELILGVDANVTLPGGHGTVTGMNVRTPLPSHTPLKQRQVLSWLEGLEAKLWNTFGEYCDSNWTRCKRRSDVHASRSQIDFIGATAEVSGMAQPLEDTAIPPFCESDHRPVLGVFSVTDSEGVQICPLAPSLKG